MKKLLVVTFLLLTSVCIQAQDVKSVFSSTEIVWYGLDFSKAKFVGDFAQFGNAGAITGTDLKNKWIPGWNGLVVSEPQNFNLKKSFRKDVVINDLSSVTEINKTLDEDRCMTYNEGKIEKSDIETMVKKYKGENKAGVGLSFIVENFNKTTQYVDIYVTFFDIASNKLLLTEKVSGKVMGIGMRNYWAGGIKAVLKQIDASEFGAWKSKYK